MDVPVLSVSNPKGLLSPLGTNTINCNVGPSSTTPWDPRAHCSELTKALVSSLPTTQTDSGVEETVSPSFGGVASSRMGVMERGEWYWIWDSRVKVWSGEREVRRGWMMAVGEGRDEIWR